ncbi:MAG: helix-turn-helix transcriptional regulator [Alphaproteobacteria bacterium]|jgi:transcriptional regulator with XRE-family HTH domain|nr:helix-turn-helix transcriptional regulator [Alphaproteobacteria bacterium]
MTVERIGERLRRHRRAAGRTLAEVAAAAGVSTGFLSQAERNLTGVSISSLANIARALDVPLRQLFDQPTQDRPDTRQGLRQAYAIEGRRQTYERLSTTFPGSVINAVKLTMPSGYQSEAVSHDGDEFVYVLSGQVRYLVGDDSYVLGPGDSLHFPGHTKHDIRVVGDGPAEVISVGTLPIFDDVT